MPVRGVFAIFDTMLHLFHHLEANTFIQTHAHYTGKIENHAHTSSALLAGTRENLVAG